MVKRRFNSGKYRSMQLRQRKRLAAATRGSRMPLQIVHYSRMGLGKAPHFFKRTFRTTYAVTDSFQSRANVHMLANLPNVAEFTALFDSYRINLVKAKFVYSANSSNTPSTALNFLPELVSCNDYDDGVALAGITDFEQYETFKIARLDRPITRVFKPKIAQAAYAGGAFNGYVRPIGVKYYIDAANTNVEHYGLKWAIRGDTTGGAGLNTIGYIDVYWTYYIVCRDVQ